MAFNLLGNAVKTVGNVAGDVVSLPDQVVEGYLHEMERRHIRPISILGGKSVGEVLPNVDLMSDATVLIVVGPAIFAFYKAKGYSIGRTNVLDQDVSYAKEILKNILTVVLPKDVVVSDEHGAEKVVAASEIPDDSYGVDMAPSTIDVISEALKGAAEVKWNAYYVKGLIRKLAQVEEDGATITILSPKPEVDDKIPSGDDVLR